jgi:hypothetical protein
MLPATRPRRPPWLRKELSQLDAQGRQLEKAIASLEAYQARHGEETDPKVILGLEEARDRLKEVRQRRHVLVQGWQSLCSAARRIGA